MACGYHKNSFSICYENRGVLAEHLNSLRSSAVPCVRETTGNWAFTLKAFLYFMILGFTKGYTMTRHALYACHLSKEDPETIKCKIKESKKLENKIARKAYHHGYLEKLAKLTGPGSIIEYGSGEII